MEKDRYSTNPRIDTVYKMFNSGKRASDFGTDTSMWVREGLKTIEQGKEFTKEDLERVDSLQNISTPYEKVLRKA